MKCTFPLSIFDILNRYMKAWAYDWNGGDSVFVDHGSVAYLRAKFAEHGHPEVKVYCRG